jgi:hypothetical protein
VDEERPQGCGVLKGAEKKAAAPTRKAAASPATLGAGRLLSKNEDIRLYPLMCGLNGSCPRKVAV